MVPTGMEARNPFKLQKPLEGLQKEVIKKLADTQKNQLSGAIRKNVNDLILSLLVTMLSYLEFAVPELKCQRTRLVHEELYKCYRTSLLKSSII